MEATVVEVAGMEATGVEVVGMEATEEKVVGVIAIGGMVMDSCETTWSLL